MNMELPFGMMTPYFVTQYEHSTANLENPAVLVSRKPLTLDILAPFLAFLNEDPPLKPKFRLFGKPDPPPVFPPALNRAATMLRAITAEARWPTPAESVYTSHPVVVLANSLELDALQALTVIKLRGFFPCLALDISKCMEILPGFVDVLGREKPEGALPFTASDGVVTGYNSYRDLAVVSGLHATIFATGLTTGQILEQHPELVSAPRQPQEGSLGRKADNGTQT